VSNPEQVAAGTTPLAKSMALSIGINHVQHHHYGGTSHLLMRILASHTPGNWSGATHVDKAYVDAWMDFVWSAIDIPVELLQLYAGCGDAIQKELESALAILERHLTYQTFLVGKDGATIADIALTAALHTAASKGFWKPSPGTNNLTRFYETMIHQEFWIKALEVHVSAPENGT
jgi:glutathione S-transferase